MLIPKHGSGKQEDPVSAAFENSGRVVIVGSRLLAGVGFGRAYPTLSIQALTGVAIATAAILGHMPTGATPARSVHAFTAGTYVSAGAALLRFAIAVAGRRDERRARAAHFRAIATDTRAAQVEALDLAA